ncbi:squalene/phytoene synthase family protein [Amylibacter sp. IMCC11727]|uniref:phytoene/squalene synthase family protein n=1 Tax=Amylibacter sp. IMCC11727 TaxID=3039851 RepID=UPI00244E07E0|nr:squalene/phytoene synthase family protein [Amylibacter sp. IMCC11727]WGI20886.1 squalene/phytoene synthase family protein [Amylibacter sp. IMCC11727]
MQNDPSEDIALCAETVRTSDPDRFLSAMTASGAVRDALMVLYAFNVEVSRAPWVTAEPMIAEMRLQWWLDAVEEIFDGGEVRRHQVVTPLAELVRAQGLRRDWLDGVIQARQWDIYKEPHANDAALKQYLDATGGGLMGLAVAVSGGESEAAYDYGAGCAVARLLMAVPALEEADRYPLVDGTQAGVKTLAEAGLARADAARQDLRKIPRPARAALRAEWFARGVLKQAVNNPALVGAGLLGGSEAGKKLRLMRLALMGGF